MIKKMCGVGLEEEKAQVGSWSWNCFHNAYVESRWLFIGEGKLTCPTSRDLLMANAM
jgi:hypothetical protein